MLIIISVYKVNENVILMLTIKLMRMTQSHWVTKMAIIVTMEEIKYADNVTYRQKQ